MLFRVNEMGMHSLTLSFEEGTREQGFLLGRHSKLKSRVGFGIVLATSYIFLAVSLELLTEGSFNDTDDGNMLTKVRLFMWMCEGIILVVLAIVSVAPQSIVGPQSFEALVAVVSLQAPIALALQDPWYLPKLCGLNPDDVLVEPTTDHELLLWLDIWLTGCHFMLPLRWKVLLPMEVSCLICYLIPAVLGGRHDSGFVTINSAMFLFLIVLTAVGKRDLESHERISFVQLAQERTMRANAEHRLFETAQGGMEPPRQPAAVTLELASNSETTSTGKLFGSIGGTDRSISEQLEEVKNLGKAEHWLIELNELQPLPDSILGSGGCGVVQMALYHGAQVVVKTPRTSRAGSARKYLSIAQELRIFRRLRHPNVALFFGAAVDPVNHNILLVLEHVRGSDLSQALRCAVTKARTCEFRCSLINDVCCAVSYLHAQDPPVIHGDLKHANVLVERHGADNYRAKLLDFGLSRLLTPNARDLGGTARWCAIEVLSRQDDALALSADIFSLGRLIYFILTGEPPLNGLSPQSIRKRAFSGEVPELSWPEDMLLRKPATNLVSECTAVVPASRPSIGVVLDRLRSWTREADSPDLAFILNRVFAPAGPPVDSLNACRQLTDTGSQSFNSDVHRSGSCSMMRVSKPGRGQLLCPKFEETPESTRKLSLGGAVASWNIQIPSGVCCEYHALIHAAQEAFVSINCERCTELTLGTVWQCKECKAMGPMNSDTCPACGSWRDGAIDSCPVTAIGDSTFDTTDGRQFVASRSSL